MFDLKHIFGLILYVVIFAFIIPIILIRNKMFALLTVYFPNIDMFSTAIQYGGGPHIFGGIWDKLYDNMSKDPMTIISTITINYLALLGLTFVVIYIAVETKDFKQGWARAFFMIIITYLIPFYLIHYAQKYSEKYFQKNYYLITLTGIITAIIIIVIELFLIRSFNHYVINFIDKTFKFLRIPEI